MISKLKRCFGTKKHFVCQTEFVWAIRAGERDSRGNQNTIYGKKIVFWRISRNLNYCSFICSVKKAYIKRIFPFPINISCNIIQIFLKFIRRLVQIGNCTLLPLSLWRWFINNLSIFTLFHRFSHAPLGTKLFGPSALERENKLQRRVFSLKTVGLN